MSNSVHSTGKKLDSFLSKMSELVDVLPSQETRSRLDEELGVLIEFLMDFRNRLRMLPVVEDTNDITSTIEMIKDYVRVAESDPVMSRVLGLSSESGSLRKFPRRSLTAQNRKEAKHVAEALKELSREDVERRLADKKKYNVLMLRQIGKELGLKIPSRSTRLSIVEKIVTKTANTRGYRYLRHEHSESTRA